MSDTKHTPGPWSTHVPVDPKSVEASLDVAIAAVVNGEKKVIAEAFGQVAHASTAPAKANAALIAAAPDLLAACKAFVEFSKLPNPVKRGDYISYQVNAIGGAEAAIAKAETKP